MILIFSNCYISFHWLIHLQPEIRNLLCLYWVNKTLQTPFMVSDGQNRLRQNTGFKQWSSSFVFLMIINSGWNLPDYSRYWPGTTQDSDIKHPVLTLLGRLSKNTTEVQMHVGLVFQMRWKGVGWYSSDEDRVWTQMDSSSWQLRGFFLGFYRMKTERDLKCSLGWDQAGSHFSSKPQTQTGREQSNRRETTLVQGQLHSSVEPKEMENYTSGSAIENSSDLQKKTSQILRLWMFSLTLVQLFWRPVESKNSICFSVPIQSLCYNIHLQGELIMFFCCFIQFVHLLN